MGASTAYYLAKRGVKNIVLLEKKYLASGPTGKSVANIRPYHGVEETVKIIQRTNQVYLNFSEEVGGNAEFRNIGRVWAEPESKRKLLEDAVALSRRGGIKAEYLSIKDLEEMLPGVVTEGLAVAVLFPEAGHSNPGLVTASFAARAREMGAEILQETEVTGIEVSRGRVRSVTSSRGTVSAPIVLNATGIWSPQIGQMVGIDIPIKPTRGQGVVFRLPWDLPSFTPIFHDGRSHYVFRCDPGDLVNLINTLEKVDGEILDPDTMPEDASEETRANAFERGPETFPALKMASYRGGYSCAYDVTPDDSPIIEEAEEVGGFYNLVGWSGLGMEQAPAAGELMAELITTGKTTLVDVSIYSSRRFKENRPLASAWLFGEEGVH